MIAFRNGDPFDPARDWKARIKGEAYAKVQACPLMQDCAKGGRYPRALFGGFWHFVDEFPGIIRATYADVSSFLADAAVSRFLRRSGRILSGALGEMERDERSHRTLWLRASGQVGLGEDQLQRWRVLPELISLTEAIRTEGDLARRLLYFVAVEIVAEGIARYLSQAPRFVETLSEEGMQWFTVHLADPGDATTHEAIAYRLSLSLKAAAREVADENSLNADIQRCVDWFFAAGAACAREFAPPDSGA